MPSVEKMIQELDEPVTDDSLAPKIYPLKYVSAVDIEDVLNELFLKKSQQRSYYDFIYEEIYGQSGSSNADRDVGRLYGKVRITSEPYSNAIIVTSNSKESLAAVEDVLKQLDRPSEAGESTLRLRLKFAKASTVANSINILFAKNGSPPLRQTPQQGQPGVPTLPQQQQMQTTATQSGYTLEQEAKEEGYYPWLGGQPDNPRTAEGRTAARPVSDLVGRVRAVADERSNGLLISANVHFFPQVLKLIEDLDAPTDQVLIEARLIEVSSDFLDKLGVRWSPDGSQVFTADDYDNSILGHATAQYQKGFGGMTTVNTPSSGGTIAQTLTSLRSGILDSTVNMDFLVQFLRKTTDAKVLAEPQINIRDNETGRLFVGQKVPTLTQSQNSGSIGLSQNFVYMDVGVILEVTPHINNKGDVELRIHAESSTVVPGQTVLGGVIIDSRAFKTHLTAKNGETLVLGGIIQKQVSDTLRKTPILGDIPGLGWAFKKKDKTSREVELMVFLRPKITRSPEESRDLLEEIYRKAPNVKTWKDEIEPAPEEKGTEDSSEPRKPRKG
jgi:general secretion pathway protein D